ncbi:hypothetical protein DL95DRAFT_373550, partial [Leptodontidium sp. 2 PMI_412]
MDSDDSQEFVLVNDDDVNDYNEDGILPQPPAVLSKIQKWLEPTDYHSDSSEYQKHLNSYLPGTGEWVQETESYQQWHSSPTNGSLWLKATAGAGKSKYMDERRSLETISANELWEYLASALVTLRKVYCVVDALDEMDIDKQDFFANFVDLGMRKPSSIKLLMTSRPLPRIETFFRTSSVLQIRLEQLKVDKDIAVYVDHRLQLANVEGELKKSVRQAVGGKAQGSFLYARLMMDELLD